jgi:predicted SnoaL-like aldol condensation-catalyzing enzyme
MAGRWSFDSYQRRSMNNQEGLEFIRKYFDELFGKRKIDALDLYLDQDYFDDDIADPQVDHLKNSKEYLAELFKEKPTIGVDVKDAITRDNLISAFLEWFVIENNVKKITRKGVAIFVVNNQKIVKRHTYVYYEE